MKITTFNYEGKDISFEFSDGNRMINATEMAKPFKGKRINNFLRNQQTKEDIQLLEKRYVNSRIAPKCDILRVVNGRDASKWEQGTWMDEKLALKFAAWLSVSFDLWVYDRIEELLKTGKTEIKSFKPNMSVIKSLRLLVDQLEYHEQEIHDIKEDLSQVKDYVADLEAKITSIDENYYSVSGYCALSSIDCPLDKAKKWGYNATKLSNQKQVSIGKAYDAKYGEINTNHIDILKEKPYSYTPAKRE